MYISLCLFSTVMAHGMLSSHMKSEVMNEASEYFIHHTVTDTKVPVGTLFSLLYYETAIYYTDLYYGHHNAE